MISVFKRKINISKFKNDPLLEINTLINGIGKVLDYKLSDTISNNLCDIEIYVELSPFSLFMIYNVSEALRYKDTDTFIAEIILNDKKYKVCFKSTSTENILSNQIIRLTSLNTFEYDSVNSVYYASIVTSPYNQYYITETSNLPTYIVPKYTKVKKNVNKLENIARLKVYVKSVIQLKINDVTTSDIHHLDPKKINKVKYKELETIDTLNGAIIAPRYRDPEYCYIVVMPNQLNKQDLTKIVKLLTLEDDLYGYWLSLL